MDIGRVNNCHMWVVNPQNHHRLMPIGAVGEILLERPLLANGYYNDSGKTEQAFINGLWVDGKGRNRRFYKTVDLATYNQDGSMSFRGRMGTGMVKLRGQRLDLGEVEAHIKRFIPHEARAYVELLSSPIHSDRLVAFVTTPHGDSSLAED